MIRASYDLTIGDVTQHWEVEAPTQATLVSAVVDALMRLVTETRSDLSISESVEGESGERP